MLSACFPRGLPLSFSGVILSAGGVFLAAGVEGPLSPAKSVVPAGLRFLINAHPALKRWAKLFRPARRDWSVLIRTSHPKTRLAPSSNKLVTSY